MLMRWWTNDQLESRLTVEVQWPDGLGAFIEARAADRESKDWAGTRYDREELSRLHYPDGQSILLRADWSSMY